MTYTMSDKEMAMLNARVTVVNASHHIANVNYKKLFDFFSAYVGKKIVTADRAFLKSISPKIPDLEFFPELKKLGINNRSWRESIVYSSMYWRHEATCKIEFTDGHWMRDVTSTHIGEIGDGGILVRVSDGWQDNRTDYSAEEIIEKRKQFKDAEKAFERARSALGVFGEHDRV